VRLSIVIPVLDEAAGLVASLEALRPLRERGAEVIVVDGGSRDGTRPLAERHADRVIEAPRGRAHQMNAGAAEARGEAIVFLHADTRLPAGADRSIAAALERREWGRFDVAIEGASRWLPVIAAFMNARSRLTGIATGDQGLFVRREAFAAVGGFPPIPLMEDVAFSKAMKRRGPPACLAGKVATSGRRWERHGVARTILLMWRLRLAYFLGADPARLAERYAPHGPAR
jgi:rSAM/selenodomain-associated transferase 2